MPTFFKSHKDTTPAIKDMAIEAFLADIKDGRYQDAVLTLRNTTDKEKRKALKLALPCLMPSAIATGGKVADCQQHTGFLIADIDNVDNLSAVLSTVRNDPYTYAAFVSAGGAGICAFIRCPVRKNEDEHYNSFLALEAYYHQVHGITLDHSGCNWNRKRAVSFDPDLYTNYNAKVFTDQIKPPKVEHKPIIFGNSDVERVLNELVTRGCQLVETYHDWITIGYALYSYDPSQVGLDWYKAISRNYSGKYNERAVEAKWRSFNGSHPKATIAAILHRAKRFGIEPVSRGNREVAVVATAARRAGVSKEEATRRAEAADLPDPDGIIEQVYSTVEQATDIDLPLSEQLRVYLLSCYDIRRNLATNEVELNEAPLTDIDLNTITLNAMRDVSTKANAELVRTTLYSDRVATVNPLVDYLNSLDRNEPVATNFPLTSRWVAAWADPEQAPLNAYAIPMMARWGIAMVGSVLDPNVYNEIMPVLHGLQGVGKTRLVRKLMPPVLMRYYTEAHFGDADKDFHTLLSKHILVLNDEFSGSMKKEAAKLKAMLSSKEYTFRAPYARLHTTVKRIASFIATSNETELIADTTGNRRVIPICVKEVNDMVLDSVNGHDLLSEWVTAFRNGERHWINRDELDMLAVVSEPNQRVCLEEELFLNHCYQDTTPTKSFSEIMAHLCLLAPSMYKFNQTELHKVLDKYGLKTQGRKHATTRVMLYPVCFEADAAGIEKKRFGTGSGLPF